MLNLSLALAKFRFKLKNEGSYLGIIWYLLSPLLLFTLLFLIFNDRIGGGIEKYPLYLLIGIIMFNFFQSVSFESASAIIDNRGLVKSVKFPRESLILSNLFKTLFSHFFEIAILAIFLIAFKVNLFWLLAYIPILLLFCIFVYGISLTLASLNVYINDIQHIWNFLTKLLWFATPIFYAIGAQTKLFAVNLLNPLYYFITIARETIIYNRLPQAWIMLTAGILSFSSLIIGICIFKKSKKRFAEKI